ncbi:hypothetical protein OE749_08145 [Aestuariibacter sp. AA17]|uniref:DUF4189 domain-containing protein n=1 Tax=Fluctibacter corallii TaxID=2984329 RepID=A0ABT3A7W6_9ALTE|nr:hypothetical protein [Aestuariibacter sp. AA17]MCV2884664.1 hypothetical protein [Aestuariibacter sp. AA17]
MVNLIVFSIVCLAFTVQQAVAQQVPSSLPSEAAIEAYLKYQSRPAYSAFAVSPLGVYGESWSYGLISSADDAAISQCEEKQPDAPCYVVARDGESLHETTDVFSLRQHLTQERLKPWEPIEAFHVAMQVANNLEQAKAYRTYLTRNGNKAFAIAFGGAWGEAYGETNAHRAQHLALQSCEQKQGKQGQCQIIDTNQQATMGRIKSTILANADNDIRPLQAPTPDNSQRLAELAKTLLGDKWHDYQNATRHKAFAISQFGAIGIVQDHATPTVAEEAAILKCEGVNALREAMPHLQDQIAPCVAVAVNNDFNEANIKQITQSLDDQSSDTN